MHACNRQAHRNMSTLSGRRMHMLQHAGKVWPGMVAKAATARGPCSPPPQDLSEEELTRLREEVDQYTVEGDLRRFNSLNIKRLKEIGCYRGRRHFNVSRAGGGACALVSVPCAGVQPGVLRPCVGLRLAVLQACLGSWGGGGCEVGQQCDLGAGRCKRADAALGCLLLPCCRTCPCGASAPRTMHARGRVRHAAKFCF